jgi:hypothetical protein
MSATITSLLNETQSTLLALILIGAALFLGRRALREERLRHRQVRVRCRSRRNR